jgi:hypothetical protein
MLWRIVSVLMALSIGAFGTANRLSANDPITATQPSQANLLQAVRNASTNWQAAGLLSVGGIPLRTAVCATVRPLDSGQDDTTNIQNAIRSCPNGQVVSLAAGTFTIAEGNYVLLNKGITLRGAGPGVTTLTRTGGATLNSYIPGSRPSSLIIVGPQLFNNGETATTLTADVAEGSYSVQVASTRGFSVGQFVLIDEASGASYQDDPLGYGKIWAAPDFRVTWQKHNPSQRWDDFSANQYPYTPGSTGCYFSNCDRPTSEIHLITAISGNTITFDSPITISYRVNHQAQLYYFQTPFVINAGVEDMTLQFADQGNIQFRWTAYCWAKNVESRNWLNGGFVLSYAFRDQLEEVWSHDAVWPVPGGAGYAIDINFSSSEILAENSITDHVNKVMVIRSAGAGSVIAYNYFDDGYINGQEKWLETGINGSHATGSHHTLFEGNWGFNIDSDNTHGSAIFHTFFRNYASGYRSRFTSLGGVVTDDISNRPGGNRPLRGIGVMAYTYWMTFLGNVLGTSGHTSGWLYHTTFANGSPGIYMLGWNDKPPYNSDPDVAKTAIIDGNFDYLSNSVSWASSDSTHTLPNSLYLHRTPAFFNAGSGYTWPWVNPTGTPQLYTNPAKARYDAGTPFTQP